MIVLCISNNTECLKIIILRLKCVFSTFLKQYKRYPIMTTMERGLKVTDSMLSKLEFFLVVRERTFMKVSTIMFTLKLPGIVKNIFVKFFISGNRTC